MTSCPCGSPSYLNCCGPYHKEQKKPQTPEALMRSRYSAYCLANIAYIKKTMQGKPLLDFNEVEAKKWAESVVWLGLEILKTQTEASKGFVTFKARYLERDLIRSIHEKSEFILINDTWFYTDGDLFPETAVKVSRNSLCPCHSQKKFKNCHGI